MGNPYASVIICTMGTPTKVLKDLENQTFKDFEVIIASEEGIVTAMNAALDKAKGKIFVRIDDDVQLPQNWLKELIAPFHMYNAYKVGGTTGPTFVPNERRKFRDSIRLAENPGWFLKWLYDGGEFNPGGIRKCGCVSYDSNYEERFNENNWARVMWREPDYLEGTNWAMQTELIRRVGGFDPAFDGVCEWFDTDAEQKIKKLGYRLVYNPRAYLYHLLQFTEHYNDRFDGGGRIKNWIQYHRRHSRFHYKMLIYLAVWVAYFISVRFKCHRLV